MKEGVSPRDAFSRAFLNNARPFDGREPGQDRELNLLGYFQWILKIHRTANRPGALFQHVGVNHGGADVFVAQEFLNGANVIARFQKVRGETVSKRVNAGRFRQPGGPNRIFHGALKGRFMDMVARHLPLRGLLKCFGRGTHIAIPIL
jgi:hypothetical protein